MTLSPKQRDKRAAVLTDHDHACWFCGRHAEQMTWDEDGTPICRSCYVTLAKARPEDVPPSASRDDKKHYLDTMRILGRSAYPVRPRFTTAKIKTKYPVPIQKPANISSFRQKLLDKRNRDVG